MSDLSIHEVLVKARNTQERRGYRWGNGYASCAGSCCPGACIAEAIGADRFIEAEGHPASEALAREFEPQGRLTLSFSVLKQQVALGRAFMLSEILAAFDKAIAATAPPPPDPTWSDLTEEVEAIHA